jgi:fumarylacetoacetate (FAA) hydrolase
MEQAFNTPPIPLFDSVPVMYQGASDDFLGPHDDVPLPRRGRRHRLRGRVRRGLRPGADGASPESALACVRLVVQVNDWSLRALGPHEMKTGFGFLQAKPSTAFAPVAVTPDELGDGLARRPRADAAARAVERRALRRAARRRDELLVRPAGGARRAHARLTARQHRRLGHGVEPRAQRRLGLHRRAPRDREDRPRRDPHRLHALRRPRAHAGAFDDGRDGPFGVIEQRVVAAHRSPGT